MKVTEIRKLFTDEKDKIRAQLLRLGGEVVQAKSIGFRADINGLRAYAVLFVLIYHFWPDRMSGGFIGVDVFFVISGFLMTAIIDNRLCTNSFSYFEFCSSRVKRIVPPLLFLLVALFLFSFFLLPTCYSFEVYRQIFSSSFFTSNLLFSSQAGYFATVAKEKWLLHTWSLAVEFQFYLLYPFLYVLLSKMISRCWLRRVLLGILVISSIGGIFYAKTLPDNAYYLLQCRFWEMLAGGIIYLNPLSSSQKKSVFLEVTGLFLISYAAFTYSDDILWPSIYTILPVGGASLVLIACRNNSFFTGNKLFQLIGSASYSIYLWHWPIVVFITFFYLTSFESLLVGCILSIVLGYLFYQLVEKKVRVHDTKRIVAFSVVISLLLACCCKLLLWSVIKSPIEFPSVANYSSKQFHKKYYGGRGIPRRKKVLLGSLDKKSVVLVGDSFGRQYGGTAKRKAEDLSYSLIGYFKDGCIILPEFTKIKKGQEDKICSDQYSSLKKVLSEYPHAPVIFAYSWRNYKNVLGKINANNALPLSEDDYFEILRKQFSKIIADAGTDREYYFVAAPERTPFNTIDKLLRSEMVFGEEFTPVIPRKFTSENEKVKWLASTLPNSFFIDPNEILCGQNNCQLLDEKGRPLRSDRGHLSRYGADIVLEYILSKV